MQAICLVCLSWVLLAALCRAVPDNESERSFVEYIAKYGKVYNSKMEFNKHFENYKQNVKLIDAHNSKGQSSSVWGINKYTDWSIEEFRSKMLLPRTSLEGLYPGICKIQPSEENVLTPKDLPITLGAVPNTWNWTAHGAVTSVKDQGTVGTCWAFSTSENIEGQWFLANHTLVSLSQEQLSDCDPYDCGVFGGWPCRAYQYVMDVGGLMSEEQYPYCVGDGSCYPCPLAGWNKTFCGPPVTFCNKNQSCRANKSTKFVAKIKSWSLVTSNEEDLVQVVYQKGPISALMNAQFLQFHSSGVYDPSEDECDPKGLDHAVLIVGYGTYDSWVYGTQKYWLVKNSWGKDWADMGGYFMILRGEGTCGINTALTTSNV